MMFKSRKSKWMAIGLVLSFMFFRQVLSAAPEIQISNGPDAYFSQFMTPEMQFTALPETFSSVPTQVNLDSLSEEDSIEMSDFKSLKWTPTGAPRRFSQGCDYRNVLHDISTEAVRRSKNDLREFDQKLSNFITACESEVAIGNDTLMANLLSGYTMKHAFSNNSLIQPVEFHIPGKHKDIKISGLLALKGDFKKRPLVIMRVGIFGNANAIHHERYMALQLFEQSPFNLIILESTSGSHFIENNGSTSFGGFEEGIQNLYIAKLLRNQIAGKPQPLNDIIESLHFVGVSLGGHGAFFASILNETKNDFLNITFPKLSPSLKIESDFQSPIESFLQICPLVDFKSNYENLIKDSIKGKILNLLAYKKLNAVSQFIKPNSHFSKLRFLEEVIQYLNLNYKGTELDAPFVNVPSPLMDPNQDLFHANNFWPYFGPAKTPIMIFSTTNDALVDHDLNAVALAQGRITPNIQHIYQHTLQRGNHCSLPNVYDWSTLASIFQSYIFWNSPKYHQKMIQESVNTNGLYALNDDVKSNDSVEVEIQFRVVWREIANESKPYLILDSVKGAPSIVFSLKNTDFQFGHSLLTDVEKDMLERWIQQNVQVFQNVHSKNFFMRYWKGE